MTIEEIRTHRCHLENQIGHMLRNFERLTDTRVSDISFGPLVAVPVGAPMKQAVVQPREQYECLIRIEL